MRTVTVLAVLFVSSAGALIGCPASFSDLCYGDACPPGPDGGGTPDGDTPSGIVDSGPPDAPVGIACEEAEGGVNDCAGIPAGWEPVGYLDDGSICGAGFDSQHGVTGPIAGGSCSCGDACSVTGTKCPADRLTEVRWDNTLASTCGDTSAGDVVLPANHCYDFTNSRTMNHFRASARPTAATCSLKAIADVAGLTGKRVNLCLARDSSCRGVLCARPHACIVRDGSVACPNGFESQRIVGTSATLSCSKCGCSYSATCTQIATLHREPSCGDTGDSVAINGVCNVIDSGSGSPKTYGAIKYAPTVSSEKCTPVGDSKPTRTLEDSRTVCCKP